MGDLVLMRSSTAPSRDRLPVGGSAEILFFTGVRYYRMPETAEVEPVRRRRSKPRAAISPRVELQA